MDCEEVKTQELEDATSLERRCVQVRVLTVGKTTGPENGVFAVKIVGVEPFLVMTGFRMYFWQLLGSRCRVEVRFVIVYLRSRYGRLKVLGGYPIETLVFSRMMVGVGVGEKKNIMS